MRCSGGLTGFVLCGLLLTASPIRGVCAEVPCPIPDALALRDIALPAAKREVTTNQQLIILTFGGIHPAGADAETNGATYPARLEAELRAALPGIEVTVKNEPPPGSTSADVPAVLADLIATTGARLVIWGPGGRDEAAHLDLDRFSDAVLGGIEAVR